MSEWQPIEAAPHDGTDSDREMCGLWVKPVLLFVPDKFGGKCVVGQCDGGQWLYVSDVEDGACSWFENRGPSHWMPLPEPPEC